MNGIFSKGEEIAAAAVEAKVAEIASALRQVQDRFGDARFSISQESDRVRIAGDLSGQLARDGALRGALGGFA